MIKLFQQINSACSCVFLLFLSLVLLYACIPKNNQETYKLTSAIEGFLNDILASKAFIFGEVIICSTKMLTTAR
jgi:hypothetical protein